MERKKEVGKIIDKIVFVFVKKWSLIPVLANSI